MATFVWVPTYGSSLTIQPEVLVIPPSEFGSDKERRVKIGSQHIRRMWSLSFENRASTTADAIEAFLAARGGLESFDWTPPQGSSGKWVCDEWSSSPTSPNTRTVNCTFREVHSEM